MFKVAVREDQDKNYQAIAHIFISDGAFDLATTVFLDDKEDIAKTFEALANKIRAWP